MATTQTVIERLSSLSNGVSSSIRSTGRIRNPSIVLAVIVTCQLMLVLDGTVVNIALPHIQQDLHFSPTNLSWIFNAYMLAFGGLLLLGGRAGDIFGRRRMFIVGLLLFTFASLLGGFSPSALWLIVTRIVQGIGAALAAPSALALIAITFTEGPQRTRALSIYSAVSSAGGSLGLILGGMLTSWVSWRWVLFINVPVGIAAVLLAPVFISEAQRSSAHRHLDVAGTFTSTIGMAALVFGFIRASSYGWGDGLTLWSFAVAIVLLGAFLLIESRTEQPIMPLRLFADRNRASAYLNMLLFFATMFGVFFFLTQFLQDVLGFGPLVAGLAFLPMTVMMFTTVRIIPRLLSRFGAKPIMVVGALLVAGGILGLSRISVSSSYFPGILGPMLLLGIGIGCSILPLNVIILSGVPQQDTGSASGVLQTMQQTGASLGLAILVTVFGTASRNATTAHSLVHASVQTQAHYVLASGISSAFTVSTIFAVSALVLALVAIRTRQEPAKPSGLSCPEAESTETDSMSYATWE